MASGEVQMADRFRLNLPPHYYQTAWFDVPRLPGRAWRLVLGGYAWRLRRMTRKQRNLQNANDILESKNPGKNERTG